jgi:hypothetical protein
MEFMSLMLHKKLYGEFSLQDLSFSWQYSFPLWGVMPEDGGSTVPPKL